jgi:putative hydrolases of HD superfamily
MNNFIPAMLGVLQKDIDFIAYIDRLKTVIRANGLFDGSRDENTAEHSWHAAISAMVLAEYANEAVDMNHVIQMLLVHDLVEIEAGDVPIYDVKTLIAQEVVEAEAAVIIFDQKAAMHGERLRALWDEFEARITPDAKFAKAIDRFLPFFSNFYNRGYSWLPYNVSVDQVQNSIALIRDGSTRLADLAEAMVEIAVRDGFLGK